MDAQVDVGRGKLREGRLAGSMALKTAIEIFMAFLFPEVIAVCCVKLALCMASLFTNVHDFGLRPQGGPEGRASGGCQSGRFRMETSCAKAPRGQRPRLHLRRTFALVVYLKIIVHTLTAPAGLAECLQRRAFSNEMSALAFIHKGETK